MVATGAHRAIQTILNDKSGSFMIVPALKGLEPGFPLERRLWPFCIGEVRCC
jgi:hypothetical protein